MVFFFFFFFFFLRQDLCATVFCPRWAKNEMLSFDTKELTFLIIGGFFFAVTVVWWTITFSQHVRSYRTEPLKRKLYVMFILCLVPVFECSSFFSLLFMNASFVLEAVQCAYEGLVVWWFYKFLVEILGGFDEGLKRLEEEKHLAKIFAVPPCLCCFRSACCEHCFPCFRPTTLGPRSFRFITILAVQLAIVQPSMCVAILVMRARGADSSSSTILALSGVNTISMTTALYALFVLYVATHDILLTHRTTAKFVAVKLGLIFIVLQKLLLGMLAKWTTMASQDVEEWQAFLIVVEFFGVHLLHQIAFPPGEYDSINSPADLELDKGALDDVKESRPAAGQLVAGMSKNPLPTAEQHQQLQGANITCK
eukprot:gnl/Spiro4/257_TR158_c0_g1_i1.p1 gnl/Spiro4/257_TR158_c0_g1~~gnl/Spiro4/257_TR158_c0_g1_i1.p1  ORF type:complete len:367 (+),score=81.45 gnl/Spiro4/257_TR158_c0_g1_i1:1-1101(+)